MVRWRRDLGARLLCDGDIAFLVALGRRVADICVLFGAESGRLVGLGCWGLESCGDGQLSAALLAVFAGPRRPQWVDGLRLCLARLGVEAGLVARNGGVLQCGGLILARVVGSDAKMVMAASLLGLVVCLVAIYALLASYWSWGLDGRRGWPCRSDGTRLRVVARPFLAGLLV